MPRIIDILQAPVNASEHGVHNDAMNEFLHRFMFVLLIGWSIFLLYVLWRFRARKHPRADYHGVRNHVSTHLEIAVILVEAVLLLGFAYPLWAQRVEEWPSGPDVEEIRAVGFQFGWAFHYPGPDGMFGRVDRRLFVVNNAGLDRDDPNGKDDIISAELILPKGRKVVINVTSKDVIHNLGLVNMRHSQDAVPGVDYPMWFVPRITSPPIGGDEPPWEVICGQLCGDGHSSMRALMEVKTAEKFDEWVIEKAPKPEAVTPAGQ